jgi:hypothetical protein
MSHVVHHRGLLLLGLLLAGSVAASAHGQTALRSTLHGRVFDATGAPLERARVTLSGTALLGGPMTMETDAAGRYRFPRLLPGAYALEAMASGFRRQARTGIELPADTTWTIDFRLALPAIAERVDVEAMLPMIDVTTAATPAVLGSDLLRHLPTSRTLTGMLNLAPGVTEGVAYGGTQHANGIALDGVSLVEPVLGRHWVPVAHAWLQEVQVQALGASAEYGQSTGATASGVLRSGGNRPTAYAEVLAAAPEWTGDNTGSLPEEQRSQFPPHDLLHWWDVAGHAGGPILRDRAWFFSGLSVQRERYRPFGYPGPDVADRYDREALVKLDAAPSARLRAQGFYQRDTGRLTGEQLSSFSPTLETSGRRRRHNDVWHARLTWIARENTVVEARINGYTGSSSFGPVDPARADGPGPAIDSVVKQLSRNVQTLFDDDRRVAAASVKLMQRRRLLAAEHDFALGLEVEGTRAHIFTGTAGGRTDYLSNGTYVWSLLWAGNDVRLRTRRWSAYVQDRWSAGRGVTIEPGLRIERYGGAIRDSGSVLRTTPIGARLGVAWDVAERHRTVVRAHYGRYHDMLLAQIFSPHDTAGLSPYVFGEDLDGVFVEAGRSLDAIPAYPIAADLRTAHVDQLTAGVEHQLAAGATLEARYVGRRFGAFTGYVDRRLDEWAAIDVNDPGPDGRLGTADDGGILTDFVPYWWPNGERDLIIGQPEGARRSYDALQLIGRVRRAHRYEAHVSWTWSRTAGSVPGLEGTNATLGALSPLGFGGAPPLAGRAFNRSPFDYSELKTFGWARPPRLPGTMLAAVYRRHNGQRWHRIVRAEHAATGWPTSMPAEEPFSRTAPSVGLLDVRVEQPVAPGRPSGRLSLTLDVMNATNTGVARRFVAISGSDFGKPVAWTDPRTIRIGLSWTF